MGQFLESRLARGGRRGMTFSFRDFVAIIVIEPVYIREECSNDAIHA